MGRRSNQKFVHIPFAILVDALKLYGIEHGIEVVDDVDEAYSSKSNGLYGDVNEAQKLRFLDKKDPKTKELRATAFQGRRHKGAFYCQVTGKIWHSDLNGALNHLRIYLGDELDFSYLKKSSFKLECPKVLDGEELKEWLDRPYQAAS